jgi:hypothetical protein
MTIKNADMPAMPIFSSEAKPCQVRDTDTQALTPASGLTKREQFAAMAMQGILASKYVGSLSMPNGLVITAIGYADALLVQLEKDQ